jgi:kynureninase
MAGYLFRDTAREMVKRLHETRMALGHRNYAFSGTKFFVSHTLAAHFFSDWILKLNQRVNGLKFELITGETYEGILNLSNARCDLLMIYSSPLAPMTLEEKAFPSDQYMFQTQVDFHGYKADDAIVEIKRREGEHNIRLEDIIAKINEVGDELALVLIGGVNYYTGQVFDMKAITEAGHKIGAMVGFDLAHAAGNVKLELHDWNIDFAAWCSYNYMNSGPGNASGCFVHEKHHANKDLSRFGGWWGHNKQRRFIMEPEYNPIVGADGWQISNLPILSLAPYLASVEMFNEVGMEKLIRKRNQLTAYLEFILHEIDREIDGTEFEIITPANQEERACQLSVFLHGQGRSLFDYLMKNGVITDWREPNVIRLAPAPFYCSYEDMYDFGQILKQGILSLK